MLGFKMAKLGLENFVAGLVGGGGGGGNAGLPPGMDSGKVRAMRSRLQGEWGERMAEEFLLGRGWKVIGRNVRPCRKDRRCEIDRVFLSEAGGVVFVEVKTHLARTEYDSRLKSVDARKKRVLLRACANWLQLARWKGDFRFDVVEVWGSHASKVPPEIDHIENVPLFGANWRFW